MTRSGFLQKQEVYVRLMKERKSYGEKMDYTERLRRSADGETGRRLPPDTCCHGFGLCFFLCHGLELPCPLPVFWVCVCSFLCCCSESLLCRFSFDLKDFSLLRLGSFEQLLFVLFTPQRFTWILFVKVRALVCLCSNAEFPPCFLSSLSPAGGVCSHF